MNCIRCDTPVGKGLNRLVVYNGIHVRLSHIFCPKPAIDALQAREVKLHAENRKLRIRA